MLTLLEQFETAPKRNVVPLKVAELSKDERWLPVHQYPWNLKPTVGEMGLLGNLHGRIVSAVYERVICQANLVDVRGEFRVYNGVDPYESADAERYVAEPVPNQKFLDSRGQ